RHVAFGRLALKDAYADLTEAERDEREEFVVEGSYLLRDRFLAEEIWDTLGLPVEECVEYVDNAQIMTEFRKALFSRVVPCVKDIGLWGPKVQKAFTDMGVLDFQDLDLDELSENDDRIAEEMEQILAERKERGTMPDGDSRAHALAQTVAAGTEA